MVSFSSDWLGPYGVSRFEPQLESGHPVTIPVLPAVSHGKDFKVGLDRASIPAWSRQPGKGVH